MTMDEVEQALAHWARWCLQALSCSMGYPKSSILAKRYGGNQFHSGATVLMDEKAEVIEAHVCSLASSFPHLAHVLRLYYVESGAMVQKAQRAGLSPSQFRVHVSFAKYWIAGRLYR